VIFFWPESDDEHLVPLPEKQEQKLREEAAGRNSPPEVFAAKLLSKQLRLPIPAEFDVSDEEARFYADAVHHFRN
jgi:hypothetical protein